MEALKLTLEAEGSPRLHTILDIHGIIKEVGRKELWLGFIKFTLVAS